jgi:hypothetical protein
VVRLIYDHDRPGVGSIIETVASLLPSPYGTVIVLLARYRMVFLDVLGDFAMLIFGLAVVYWFKTR